MEKALSFWSKLFTKCVSLKDYLLLKNSHDESLSKLESKIKALDNMRTERDKADKKCSELVTENENTEAKLQSALNLLETANNKVNSLENIVSEQKTKVSTLTSSLTNEKEKHEFTLKMLKDAQDKIDSLAPTTSYVDTDENVSEEVVEEATSTEEVAVCKPVKKDKLTSFIETLTSDEVTSLHQAILEAHKNDKRLHSTMQNWISKSNDILVQTTNMFRTALNRKRGKAILNAWYTKYEKYTSK